MFYFLSKLFWLFAEPANLFVILLIIGVILLRTDWARAGRRLLTGLAIAGVAIAILPLGNWLLVPLETRFPPPIDLPAQVDGIIVLGGGINITLSVDRHEVQLNEHGDRLHAGVLLAERYPQAKLVYASGSPAAGDPNVVESDMAQDLWQRLGISPERIIIDRASRNTHQNAVEAMEVVHPKSGETWLLVTSAFHMPRAVGVFQKLGWQVTPYPVDFQTSGREEFLKSWDVLSGFGLLGLGLKEWIGLTAYYVNDYSDAWFPGPGQGQGQ